MKAVIVYESVFGNTPTVADAIAEGFRPGNEATVAPLARGPEVLGECRTEKRQAR